jgi:ubiquinone/menaquinone biosynthesis C-methylase UbiE
VPEQLYDDIAFARFYDADNAPETRDDEDYCVALAASARSVLDLGSGTGTFCARVAAGRRVVGVEPAQGMLDIARAKPETEQVRWVHGDGRAVRLGETFDLIVMLGHAFQ